MTTQSKPRRTNGRLRPLTLTEKRARKDSRERRNPEREAVKARDGIAERKPAPRRRLRPDWFARVSAANR